MIKILQFFAILLLTQLSAPLLAEEDYNRVTFSANVQQDIANDMLEVRLRVLAQGHELVELADEVNTTMDWALKIANREQTIETQTLNYQTSPRYEKGRQQGWQVSQELQITGSDTAAIAEVLEKLQTRLQIESTRFRASHDRLTKLEDELSTSALKAFTRKAEAVTRALGRKNYRIVSVHLSTTQPAAPPPVLRAERLQSMQASVAAPALQAGNQKLTVYANGTIEVLD